MAPCREEQSERPGRRANRQRSEEAGAVIAIIADVEAGHLSDPLADPADGEQQDGRGDRDEYIVEAGDKAELLFVGDHRRALALDVAAKRVRRLGADHAGSDGVIDFLLAVHALFSPKSAGE